MQPASLEQMNPWRTKNTCSLHTLTCLNHDKIKSHVKQNFDKFVAYEQRKISYGNACET